MCSSDKLPPHAAQELEASTNDNLKKYFTGHKDGFCALGPKGYKMPLTFKEYAKAIYDMEVRPDDVYVVTFPRCGTTWTQEIVWLILNNLDYETSSSTSIMKRWTFIEHSSLMAAENHSNAEENYNTLIAYNIFDKIKDLNESTSQRFIKSHLAFSLLPPSLVDTCKVVYVARDPRDVAVSFYHHNRLIKSHNYIGDFKTFWDFFLKDLILYSPYFAHLKEAWEKKDNPNMLFLFYEDMVKDLPKSLRHIAKFFGKEYNDNEIEKLANYCSFDSFKNNPSVNLEIFDKMGLFNKGEEPFIRKGKVGGWREVFDDTMTKQAQVWMEENLKETDIEFPKY